MANRSQKYLSNGKLFLSVSFLFISFLSNAQFTRLYEAGKTLSLLKFAMHDTARLELVDALAEYYISKPGESKTDLDSALNILRQNRTTLEHLNNAAWTGKYFILQSKALREGGDNTNGKLNIEKALAILNAHHLTLLEAHAMWEKSQYYPFNTSAETVIKTAMLQKAADLYEQAGAIEQAAHALEVLGDILQVNEEYDNAVKVLKRSLEMYNSIRSTSLYGVYDLLGFCYTVLGDNQKAISYGLLAVKSAQLSHDTGTIVTIYNRLANSYYGARLFEESIVYFKRSLTAATNVGDTSDMILLNVNLAMVYRTLHQQPLALAKLKYVESTFIVSSSSMRASLYRGLILTYTDLRDFPKAVTYINKLEAITTDDKVATYAALIQFYLATKDYDKVYKYCDSSDAYNDERNIREGRQGFHLWRFKADSALKRYIPAIREYQLFKRIEDSLYSEKNRKEIAHLNIEYESDQKDNAIKSNQLHILNLEKADKFKTEQINKARFNRNMIIFGTGMLLLLLALLYNQYRIKQKSNKDLLLKQEEINNQNHALQQLVGEKEWLVKEIHHRVKNNLQVVMSLLNTQADYSENEQSFAAIRESRQRMFAMSLIHQKLYQAEQMTVVSMSNYIPELVDFLKDSFDDSGRIRFELKVENIELDVSQAVPVGLMLNEIVTNSIKYAFSDLAKGSIRIEMNMQKDDRLHLAVSDNGIGLPADFDLAKKGTMGMQLIKTLAEQVGGIVSFTNKNGLLVELAFTKKSILQH